MIPKVINYVWFGGPKSDKIKRCIDSWGRILPDWNIQEWSEKDFDFDSAPKLIKKYINKEKWAYVSDYYRAEALLKSPGFYLDTDMYMIRPIPNELRSYEIVACIESDNLVNTGVLGVSDTKYACNFLHNLMNYYESSTRIEMSPYVLTPILKQILHLDNSYLFNRAKRYNYHELVSILSHDYFYPCHWTTGSKPKYKPKLTDNTICIHEWTGSALSKDHFTASFEYHYRELITKYLKENDL